MKNKKQPIEIIEEKKFNLDWRKTLILNSGWIIFLILGLVFYFLVIDVVSHIENEVIQIIALIGTLFCMLKFASWIGFPTFYEKDKEVESI